MTSQGFKKESGINPKQILFHTNPYDAVPVVVGSTGVTADTNGKKIIKAGTPLVGSLRARNTAFSVVSTAKDSSTESNVKGVTLHDVDVTDGTNNAELLILGDVNLNNLDEAIVSLITDGVEAALPRIAFLK